MEQIPNQGEDEDLGGERACWLDEVCVSCGAIHGHRPGCELTGPQQEDRLASTRDRCSPELRLPRGPSGR